MASPVQIVTGADETPVSTTNPLFVTPVSGGVDQDVNIAAVGGTATAVNGGLATAGTQRVAVAFPAIPVTGSSGNVANASAVATLFGFTAQTTYITGFQVTASGSTTALPVTVTVANTVTGSLSYTFVFPAGVLVAAEPLIVTFPTPIPASATNTLISVTCPAGGAGNTNCTVSAQGFRLA